MAFCRGVRRSCLVTRRAARWPVDGGRRLDKSPSNEACHHCSATMAILRPASCPSARWEYRSWFWQAVQTYLPPTIFTDPSENEGISLIFALRCSHVKREFLLYCLEYVWYIQTHVYHRCSPSQLSPGYSPTRVLSRRGQGAYADPRQPDLVGTGADRGPASRPQG